jgi:MerR family transcriptional regulator, redox-sensitive transcriptional activator SoxR
MERLNIGEVARRVGIRTSAIRYYESLGLLAAPDRSNGWRAYDPRVVDRLQVIRTARELGFSLEEIAQLLDGFSPDIPPSERWRAMAAEKLPRIRDAIRRATALEQLLRFGTTCRCVTIEECFLDDCSAQIHRAPRLPVVPNPVPPSSRLA